MGKYYVVTMTACILLLIGMTFHVQTNSILDEVAKSRFSMTFMGIATAITLGMMGFFLDGCLFPPFFHVVVTLMEFSLTPMLSVLLSIACGVRKQAIPIGVLMVIHAIIELVLVPFGKVFYIDSSGLYHRGPWYNLYIGAYFISFGYLFVFFFLLSKHFQKRDIKTLISGGLVVAASLIPSLIDGQIKTAFLGVTLLSVIFFVYYEGLTQQDLSTELEEQNKERKNNYQKRSR